MAVISQGRQRPNANTSIMGLQPVPKVSQPQRAWNSEPQLKTLYTSVQSLKKAILLCNQFSQELNDDIHLLETAHKQLTTDAKQTNTSPAHWTSPLRLLSCFFSNSNTDLHRVTAKLKRLQACKREASQKQIVLYEDYKQAVKAYSDLYETAKAYPQAVTAFPSPEDLRRDDPLATINKQVAAYQPYIK